MKINSNNYDNSLKRNNQHANLIDKKVKILVNLFSHLENIVFLCKLLYERLKNK